MKINKVLWRYSYKIHQFGQIIRKSALEALMGWKCESGCPDAPLQPIFPYNKKPLCCLTSSALPILNPVQAFDPINTKSGCGALLKLCLFLAFQIFIFTSSEPERIVRVPNKTFELNNYMQCYCTPA